MSSLLKNVVILQSSLDFFLGGDPTHVLSTKSLRADLDVLLHQKNVQKIDRFFFAIPCYKIVYRDFFGNLLKICDMFWHEVMFPFRTR